MKSKATFLVLLGCVFYASAQNSAPAGFDGKTWWDYVKVLAADDMEERLAALEKEDRIEQLLAELKTKRGA